MSTDDLRERLEASLARRRVPGTSVAVFDGSGITEAAAGVCNIRTGVEVTTDTLFQIGSITKLYTATVIMRLAERGLVDLDAPRPDGITMRMLLTHTSGIQGDHFEDFGGGDDCIERYVDSLRTLEPVHAPGERYSYCNAGFTVAARVAELVTGRTWDTLLREELLGPAGVAATVTRAEEAILHRAAIGHVLDLDDPANGPIRRAPAWYFSRATAPAGAICAPASDLIAFARIVLDGGVASDGTRIVSLGSLRTMLDPQVPAPPAAEQGFRHVGLAWRTYDWGGVRVLGHDGGTIGQFAFLRIVPDSGVVAVVLTNGPDGPELFRDVLAPVFAERYGIEIPDEPAPANAPVPCDGLDGVYERMHTKLTLQHDGEGLSCSTELSGPFAELSPPIERVRLDPIDARTFVARPAGQRPVTLGFEDGPDARPAWLYTGGRAYRRTA